MSHVKQCLILAAGNGSRLRAISAELLDTREAFAHARAETLAYA
jgi:choline kinase